MFRKPRTGPTDVGRPPSPSPPAKTPFTLAHPSDVPAPAMAARTTSEAVPLPTIGRQGPSSNAKRTGATSKPKDGRSNGNIMAFFKKSADEGMFVEERAAKRVEDAELQAAIEASRQDAASPALPETGDRFNESLASVKRRRLSSEDQRGSGVEPSKGGNGSSDSSTHLRSGPFLEDSDSEHEDEQPEAIINIQSELGEGPEGSLMEPVPPHLPPESTSRIPTIDSPGSDRPPLIKEETSYGLGEDDFKDFEGMEDFDEELFEEGDEYMERRYMEEQARLEALENENDYNSLPPTNNEVTATPAIDSPSCPICSLSLEGIDGEAAAIHVNNCLDGNPSPLPQKSKPQLKNFPIKSETFNNDTPAVSSAAQYRRPQRAPKPGQANPFSFGQTNGSSGGSAFNRLMSGHSEEAAWAEAAAAEHASRGKPAYQRTCPFYKILPGLFICVDAFRYGAVEGCKAYFLSHFHSDHYVGLTSHWSHGPIYCSKVTANLVKQQLRVDPAYVVALEWEKKVEVPGSRGVFVTMISANHCPGSSLFLFEKVVGKRPDGTPKLQRILHCGDFRACRAHVEHPLLMPEVQDSVSGKSREQKIDVCYLDTTYLNPKYAFPSQENVIRACADMCVSLSKVAPDETDGWEQMKRQRAGEGMVKFVQRENSIKQEEEEDEEDEETKNDMSVEKNPHPEASQQILSTANSKANRGRLLVVVGTYSIGKERICLGIAKALKSKIYAPASKQRIVAALEDPELDQLMTSDPRAAQVHMTPLFEIRAETLDDYLKDYWPHFTRAVGFRPSGWNYRPPTSRFTDSPGVATVLHSDNWKSTYSMKELVPQRGSTSRASCFGVPYSEHSSFRELTMFCTALRIEKIIPTVNVGSAKSRERMKGWCERWMMYRKKEGLFKLEEGQAW